MRRLLAVVGCAVLLSSVSLAADQYANLKFLVVREGSDKPIAYASVILHALNEEGRQESRNGLQLKTDSKGRTELRGAPFGKVRVQVIARGFQTFGEDYVIDEPTEEINIQMERPKKQYSIYDQEKKQE